MRLSIYVFDLHKTFYFKGEKELLNICKYFKQDKKFLKKKKG